MEVLYEPSTWNWDREVVGEMAVKRFIDECEKQRKAFLAASEKMYLESDAEEDYKERIELGKGMLRYYYREQMPKMDFEAGYTPVKVEVSFEVPVMHPENMQEQLYCKCINCRRRWRSSEEGTKHYDEWQLTAPREQALSSDYYYENVWQGLPVTYRGRIDCLMKDKHGDYWVFDWKTTSRMMGDDDFFLQLDDQIGSYCWALMVALGINIRGFIYHEQRKAFPEPPQENKVVRKGCKFSVSKQQATDYETYLKHVAKYDAAALKAGHYDDFLLWLKSEGIKYYDRHTVIKTHRELNNIARNIGYEVLDMISPSLNIYPSSGRFNCNWCAYREPCVGKNRGDDYQYTLDTFFTKEAPYYMRGASTESKGHE